MTRGAHATETHSAQLPNGVLGVLFLIAAEIMLFAGLISAFWVMRAQSMTWPPPGQPHLPIVLSTGNTVILILSWFALYRGRLQFWSCEKRGMGDLLFLAFGFGSLFLVVQGFEWVRLVSFGFTATSSSYGGIFYLLIGVHGVHALFGTIALGVTARNGGRGIYTHAHFAGLEMCFYYWTFVVGIWPVLYLLLYIL